MTLSRPLVILLSAAVGLTAANLYYAQPLVKLISESLGLRAELGGLVVTLTQVGYGLGVLLLVPLGDIVENKKLILAMLTLTVCGLIGLAFATHLIPYFMAAFATGLGAATVQIIVPYAAHFSSEAHRGRVVGTLMSGLMIGIMISRPLSSFLTDLFGWHAIFVASAAAMVLLAAALYTMIPVRAPAPAGLGYFALLRSMVGIYRDTELLRRRAIYQACMFGSFCLFWTAVPLHLLGERFQFSQTQIAVFALVGVSGAVSAPFAGRFADRGRTWAATWVAMISAVVAFAMAWLGTSSVVALALSGIMLDAGITATLVLGQRAIFGLAPELRGRLNGLYIATAFVGGASGSSLGAWSYARGGWPLTCLCGFLMVSVAMIYNSTEVRVRKGSSIA